MALLWKARDRYFFEPAFSDARRWLILADIPGEAKFADYKTPLPICTEFDIFRRMNCIKHRLRVAPKESAKRGLVAKLKASRDILTQRFGNMVRCAAKFPQSRIIHDPDELLGEGFLAFAKALDMFDYRKGQRFSTYAYRSVSNYAWWCLTSIGHRRAIEFSIDDYTQKRPAPHVNGQADKVSALLSRLPEVESSIVRMRFGIDQPSGMSFQAIASELGLKTSTAANKFHKAIKLMGE